MKTYLVETIVTLSCRTKVIAEDETQARAMASERTLMDAPYSMYGDIDKEFVIEDFDGEPQEDYVIKETETEQD